MPKLFAYRWITLTTTACTACLYGVIVELLCNVQGVPAEFTEGACMYNVDEWGPDGIDNGAYPFGDLKVFTHARYQRIKLKTRVTEGIPKYTNVACSFYSSRTRSCFFVVS